MYLLLTMGMSFQPSLCDHLPGRVIGFRIMSWNSSKWWWKVRESHPEMPGLCRFIMALESSLGQQHPTLPRGAKRTGSRLCLCQHLGGGWNHRPRAKEMKVWCFLLLLLGVFRFFFTSIGMSFFGKFRRKLFFEKNKDEKSLRSF